MSRLQGGLKISFLSPLIIADVVKQTNVLYAYPVTADY